MISIENKSISPYFNLALEEYALKHLDIDDDIIILWQNGPSVIIGRNQNTIEEINIPFIRSNVISVVRRLSGGGAVYHDLGNLNFTFITKSNSDNVNNYKKFTEPVIKSLRNLNINAQFSGRNDITIEGRKFSGNAQYYNKDKLLHHGTILFNSDLDVVQSALNVKPAKIKSKVTKSVKSRVTNIYPYLTKKITLKEFKDYLLTNILKEHNSSSRQYNLSENDISHINRIMKERYLTWNWNYGESPEFEIQKSKQYSGGNIDIRLNVKDGIIKNCKIYGDFFSNKDVSELENTFVDNPYDEINIREELKKLDYKDYLLNIDVDEFIDCMFN